MKQHVRVPYQLLDIDIVNEAKYVFIALLRFRSKYNKNIKVSLKQLSKIAGLGVRQLTHHINSLVNNRILSRKQIKCKDGNYSCNIYTIICDESKFAEIPIEIAFHEKLSAGEIIGYCVLKRYINLKDKRFTCSATKKMLAREWRCSLNHVDKVKRALKKEALIDYSNGDNNIILTWEHQRKMSK